MREDIRRLKDTLCDELSELSRKKLTTQSLDDVYKLVVSIEKIMKMEVLERGEDWEDNYSGRMYSRDGGYDRGGSYNGGGSSYGREHYVRGHYSRDDGKREMVDRLERMMEDAPDEMREVMRNCVTKLREM